MKLSALTLASTLVLGLSVAQAQTLPSSAPAAPTTPAATAPAKPTSPTLPAASTPSTPAAPTAAKPATPATPAAPAAEAKGMVKEGAAAQDKRAPTEAQKEQHSKMKDCAGKWKEHKAKTGEKGKDAHRAFMSTCLKG